MTTFENVSHAKYALRAIGAINKEYQRSTTSMLFSKGFEWVSVFAPIGVSR